MPWFAIPKKPPPISLKPKKDPKQASDQAVESIAELIYENGNPIAEDTVNSRIAAKLNN